jgi:glycosyltransferase involved in cell wall biosynthesis
VWRLGGHVQRCLEHVDAILAPSQFAADRHREAGITRPIHVLPSFTHFSPMPPAPDASVGTRPFVYAGRLARSKGVEHVLESFAQRPELRLLVVGDGPLASTLRERYARAPHIEFTGDVAHTEMPALFAHARAVVMPCWGPEVFPLTALEAMICGAPVIVRRAGGSAEAVERTGGGLVYDTPAELLALVDRLAFDDTLRATLSERARAGTTAEYLEETWMTAYLARIADIGRERGRSART